VYPNPVISKATLAYTLASSDHVTIDLVSIDGTTISRLYAGVKSAGKHTLVVGRDLIGNEKLKSGVYMIMVKTSSGQNAVKILLN